MYSLNLNFNKSSNKISQEKKIKISIILLAYIDYVHCTINKNSHNSLHRSIATTRTEFLSLLQ